MATSNISNKACMRDEVTPTFPYEALSDGFFVVYLQPNSTALAYTYYTITKGGENRTVGVSAYGGAGNMTTMPVKKGETISSGASSNLGSGTYTRFYPYY